MDLAEGPVRGRYDFNRALFIYLISALAMTVLVRFLVLYFRHR